MSLLLVGRSEDDADSISQGPLFRALRSAAQQGFQSPVQCRWPGGSAWFYSTPGQAQGSGAILRRGQEFAASVGALQWQGRRGEALLGALLDHPGPIDTLPFDEFSGSFVLLLGRADGIWLLGDALGLAKVYEAEGTGVLSTSLLACRAALDRVEVDRLRAQQYVLLGWTHGRATPLKGLSALDPSRALDLRSGKSRAVHHIRGLQGHPVAAGRGAAVTMVCDEVEREFLHLRGGWGGRFSMALSGGFDSRLLLAALDRAGESPRLYVYGRPHDEDVTVARQVVARLGRDIEVFDKSSLEAARAPLDAATLRRNALFFDGLPLDGIFNRGSDQQTRLLQVSADRLNLNGGGGEILRNFFYLPAGRYRAADIVAAFYSGWFDEVFHSLQDQQAFQTLLEDQILDSLQRESGNPHARAQHLSREEVELVYSTFRLRWWMGRNNAIAARYGAFMTPLVTPRLVRMCASMPIAWKDGGRLESEVITRLSPRVAAGPSAYGFAFDRGLSWRHRLDVAMTLYRPLRLRHYSLKVQRWMGRVAPVVAPAEWCAALGQEPSAQWLNPRALSRLDQMNRLLTLQAFVAATET